MTSLCRASRDENIPGLLSPHHCAWFKGHAYKFPIRRVKAWDRGYIHALCASAMAASLPPLLPLQTCVFRTRRLFSSLPRGFCRARAKVEVLHTNAFNYTCAGAQPRPLFPSRVVYDFSNKDYGYCASAHRPLDGTFKMYYGTSRFVLYRELFFIRSVLYQRFNCSLKG